MKNQRKQIHAIVSPEAHHHMHSTCGKRGVSVTAVVEALALSVHELLVPDSDLHKQAMEIDAERRKRKNGVEADAA